MRSNFPAANDFRRITTALFTRLFFQRKWPSSYECVQYPTHRFLQIKIAAVVRKLSSGYERRNALHQ